MKLSDYEDDSKKSPFEKLSLEELEFLTSYFMKNKQKLEKYTVK